MRKKIIKGLILTIISACALCLASCKDMVFGGIDTHTHEYGPWSADTATCTAPGQQTKICKICNDEQTRKTKPLGHDIVDYRDCEPSCTEYGCSGYSACLRCDYSVGERFEPLGHDMPDWTVTVEPTCKGEGARTRICNVCHEPEDEIMRPLGHDMPLWTLETEATCDTEGLKTRICGRCNESESRVVEPLGHDMQPHDDIEATCTEIGYSNYIKCSRCEHFEGEIIEPTGHDMSEWTKDTATCTHGGQQVSTCLNGCETTQTRDTARLGHSIDENGECTVCHKKGIIVLIEDGKAKFNLVVTSKASGAGLYAAESLISTLRSVGVEINDAVRDTAADSVTDCEIIIGSGALNRGVACSVTERQLGTDGTVVKMVGNRIIIAGATPMITALAFSKFVEEHLGLSADTQSVDYLEADSSCCYETATDYVIDSIEIAGIDLEQYGLVIDAADAAAFGIADINSFHDELFALSGYSMTYVSPLNMKENEKYFIIRYVSDAGDKGFRAYMVGDDFVVECAYRNVFNDTFREFADEIFLTKTGDVSIPVDFKYEKTVNVVYYEDFGAVGDGVTCDFEAIHNAHMFANAGGQKVLSRLGADAVYYISAERFIETIPIKTDVDFCGATFLINDLGDSAYTYRKLALFTLERDHEGNKYGDYQLNYYDEESEEWITDGIIDDAKFRDVTISVGDTSFPWLSDVLPYKSFVKIENKLHCDFVRHGSNQNAGATRRDVFVVDTDGTLDPDTLPVFDFDNISTIEIYRIDDKKITVENGHFINICCRTVVSTTYTVNGADEDESNDIPTTHANKFHEYQRGFIINRANATINNVTHAVEDEPELGWYPEGCGYVPDDMHYTVNKDGSKTVNFGSRHESYPYYGFVFVYNAYNFTLSDSKLTGHRTYYEDKPATASTGWQIPEPVAMGTYDFVLEYSSHITFKNVEQTTPTDLTDTGYWGIMSSNGTKNLTFDGCRINRFDAHRGFWNATLKDTYIGHSFQVVGGGTLYVENVTKAGKSNFMTFRGDYGATFEGDIILKDCKHEARGTFDSSRGGTPKAVGSLGTVWLFHSGFATQNTGYSTKDYSGGYWLWDFGYTCYLPINITIDNFESESSNVYIFNDLPDIIFKKTYTEGVIPTISTVRYPYQITKTITQMNMPALIPTCKGTTAAPSGYPTYTYDKLNEIPVNSINIGSN